FLRAVRTHLATALDPVNTPKPISGEYEVEESTEHDVQLLKGSENAAIAFQATEQPPASNRQIHDQCGVAVSADPAHKQSQQAARAAVRTREISAVAAGRV
uniref:hypothetical protein n=1 Tax=Xanthomonas fragariae TaxID=48664 RepID=UPI001F2CE1E2